MNKEDVTPSSGYKLNCDLETVRLDASLAPILCVIVDTEEEFDWNKPFDRAANSVTAIQEVGRIQDVFDRYGIKPVYACDYPIASQDESISILKSFIDADRAVVGAHLHAWVNPPFVEIVNDVNSYQGNLSAELELEKLRVLTETISLNFGHTPLVHKAGRYGLGPSTTNALQELGYKIDMSVMPGYDLSSDGGPNFLEIDNWPGVFTMSNDIVEIPTTGSIIGPLSSQAATLEKAKSRWPGLAGPITSYLGKFRVLERMRLSPEGHSAKDMIRLAKALVKRGQRVLCLSLHSPSLQLGCTPYVNSEEERSDFISRTDAFLRYFFTEMNGRTLSFWDIRDLIQSSDTKK